VYKEELPFYPEYVDAVPAPVAVREVAKNHTQAPTKNQSGAPLKQNLGNLLKDFKV
jgi:hypothetical protein